MSIVLAGLIAIVVGEGLPTGADLAWAVVAGWVGAVGIVALYIGLSRARMGLVAPITGVLAAALPVVVGGFLQGPPGPVRAAGIIVAVVAVVLASHPSVAGGSRDGIRFAIVAGIGFGLFATFISRVTPGHVFVPLSVARVADIGLLVAIVVATRRPWRIPGPALPLVLLAGVLDMGGNAFFILAAQAGRLDVASVLSSLYPVTTVILAVAVLRERVVLGQAVGIALALLAIVLIAAG